MMCRELLALGFLLALLFVLLVPIRSRSRNGPYPRPGRLAGTTAFFHEKDAPRKANASYPSWFRGDGADGRADDRSHYWYTHLVGPAPDVTTGLNARNLHFGTLVLKPGKTYPAHNHPAPEVYYVVEGEADWYVDDEHRRVTPGSVVCHRPYAVHGWKNVSDTKDLKLVWLWWAEGDMTPADLNMAARFTNPDLAKDPTTAVPWAVPKPQPWAPGSSPRRNSSDACP